MPDVDARSSLPANLSRKVLIGLAGLFVFSLGCQRARYESRFWSAVETAPGSPPATAARAWIKDPEFVPLQAGVRIGPEIVYRKIQRIDGVEVEGSALSEVRQADSETTIYLARRKMEGALQLLPRAELLLYQASEDAIRKVYSRKFAEEGLIAEGPARVVLQERADQVSPELQVDVSDPQTGEFFRDTYSLTGERQNRRPIGMRFNAQGRFAQVYPKGPKLGALAWVPVFWRQTAPKLTGEFFTVSSRSGLDVGPPSDRLAFAVTDTRFDQLQVYYFIENYLNGLRRDHGFVLPNRLQVETHIGFPETSNAAFYHQNILRFGAGDGVNYRDLMRDPTVVVHEVGHAVIDALVSLPPQGPGGAINEGFADFLAASSLDQPRMGEVSYVAGPYRRNLENPKRFGDRSGKTYADSEIVSGLFWSLRSVWDEKRSEEFALRVLARLLPDTDFTALARHVRDVGATLSIEEQTQLNQVLHERGWP